jgi:hypothetical protein
MKSFKRHTHCLVYTPHIHLSVKKHLILLKHYINEKWDKTKNFNGILKVPVFFVSTLSLSYVSNRLFHFLMFIFKKNIIKQNYI